MCLLLRWEQVLCERQTNEVFNSPELCLKISLGLSGVSTLRFEISLKCFDTAGVKIPHLF